MQRDHVCTVWSQVMLLVPEDVWQLWAPVDELVLVGQRRVEGNELNFVSTEALWPRGQTVQLQEEEGLV